MVTHNARHTAIKFCIFFFVFYVTTTQRCRQQAPPKLHSVMCQEVTNVLLLNFTFCWPCISSQILVNNQPDALFRVFIYSFHPSTCFEHQVLIIRRSNCINTSSGMTNLCKWRLSMLVRRELNVSHHQKPHKGFLKFYCQLLRPTHTHIQGVTGGTDQTSGGCSLC